MKFYVEDNGKRHEFESGSEVYIYDIVCLNGILEKDAMKYVSFIHDLYLKDQNPTPLGKLADYVCENWDLIQGKDRWEILSDFYDTLN